MLTYKQYLIEKRSNPDLNPKVSVYETIKKYKRRSDIYISMRDINKLGINPNSKFSTPNGIYAYPLDIYWDLIEKEKSLEKLPFQGKLPYVYVFKSSIKPLKVSEITKEYVLSFIEKVISEPKYKVFFSDPYEINNIKNREADLNFLVAFVNAFEIKNLSLTDLISKLTRENFDRVDYFLDWFGENSKEKIDISGKIDKQSKNILIKSMNDYIKHLQKELDELKRDNNITPESVYEIGRSMAPYSSSPGGILWWITYKIAGNNPNKWNGLFREFDIYGFEDDQGLGIIHINEPVQTVFFDKTKLEVLEVVDNKDYKEFKYNIELIKQMKKDKLNAKHK